MEALTMSWRKSQLYCVGAQHEGSSEIGFPLSNTGRKSSKRMSSAPIVRPGGFSPHGASVLPPARTILGRLGPGFLVTSPPFCASWERASRQAELFRAIRPTTYSSLEQPRNRVSSAGAQIRKLLDHSLRQALPVLGELLFRPSFLSKMLSGVTSSEINEIQIEGNCGRH